MATWNPFGVSLNITAVAETVKRTSATKFTVKLKVSWACVSSGNKTDYGMKATSGGSTVTINAEGTKRHDATAYLTGTYTVDKNVAANDKTISVTFENFNEWHDDSAETSIILTVDVPAWTSYTISYNANGGSGAPGSQTKWHGEDLTITNTKPTRTGYTFIGWALTKENADAGSWYYTSGSTCGQNKDLTLYAVWKANTYTVTYNANGGEGAPINQTKVYGSTLKLSSVKPTRADYTFKGWATSASGAVAYAAGDNYTANAGVTLYAVWESSYTKPRINNVEVFRCDSQGNKLNNGTYVSVSFDWETDENVQYIHFSWNGGSLIDNDVSGKSGEFHKIIGNGSFDADTPYTLNINVRDSKDISYKAVGIDGSKFPVDVKPPEAEGEVGGVKIGGTATQDGVFEVDFKTQLNDRLSVIRSEFEAVRLKRAGSTNGISIWFENNNGLLGAIGMGGAKNGGLLRYLNDSSKTYVVLDTGNYTSYVLPLSGGKLTGTLGVNAHLFSTSNYGLFLGVDNNREIVRIYQAGGTTDGNKWFAPCDGVLIDLGTSTNPWETAYIKTIEATTANIPTVNATTVKSSNGVMNKVYGSGNYSVKFGVNNNTELAWVYQSGGSTTGTKWFAPTTDANLLLGSSNYRWGQIYSTNSAISPSDRNLKSDISKFDERYEALFKKLKPQTFKFIDGTSGRTHSGFIAQDIEESLAEVGLTALDFAGFCKDVKTERFENAETSEVTFKEVLDENGNPQHIYSLRYEEFIALNTHMIQKLQAEKSELQDKVSRLEKRLEKLEALIETQ